MKTPSTMQALGLSAALAFTEVANADVNFAQDAGPAVANTRNAATSCIAPQNGMCANQEDVRAEQERQQLEAEKRAADLNVKRAKLEVNKCEIDIVTAQATDSPLANPTMCSEENGPSKARQSLHIALNNAIGIILKNINATLARIKGKE